MLVSQGNPSVLPDTTSFEENVVTQSSVTALPPFFQFYVANGKLSCANCTSAVLIYSWSAF
jgi:hypothetical protein